MYSWLLYSLRVVLRCQWERLIDKGACCCKWQPEFCLSFDPSCVLISTQPWWHMCTPVKGTHTKFNEIMFVFDVHTVALLEKTEFPLSSSGQLQILSCLGVGLCINIPFSVLGFCLSWTYVVLCMQPSLLRVHTCNSLVVRHMLFPWSFLPPLANLIFLFSPPHGFLSFEGWICQRHHI